VILETKELFPEAYFTHKPIYVYFPLFMSSWNMQEHWDVDLLLLRRRPNLWGFPATFAFCIKAPRLATYFIAPKNWIF